MGDSRRELILQDLETTLEGITTGNGYNTDVAHVSRKFRHFTQVDLGNGHVIIILAGPGRKEAESNLEYNEFFQVGLLGYVQTDSDENDVGTLSKELENLIKDISDRLNVDPHRGHAEWVKMTWLRRIEPYFDWDNNVGICEFIIEVEYFHDLGTA